MDHNRLFEESKLKIINSCSEWGIANCLKVNVDEVSIAKLCIMFEKMILSVILYHNKVNS